MNTYFRPEACKPVSTMCWPDGKKVLEPEGWFLYEGRTPPSLPFPSRTKTKELAPKTAGGSPAFGRANPEGLS